MAKKIVFDIEARDGIKRGVDALANAVKVTLGPKGRNVIIGKSFGAPQVRWCNSCKGNWTKRQPWKYGCSNGQRGSIKN